jgi:hypothetical protein
MLNLCFYFAAVELIFQVLMISSFKCEQIAVAKSKILSQLFVDIGQINANKTGERDKNPPELNPININMHKTRIYQETNSVTAKVKSRGVRFFYKATTARDLSFMGVQLEGSKKPPSDQLSSILTFYNLDEGFFVIKVNKELSLVAFSFGLVVILAFCFVACLSHCAAATANSSKKDAFYFCKYHQIY